MKTVIVIYTDLSMECNSTNCFAIRELVIQDKEENKIYGTLINGI